MRLRGVSSISFDGSSPAATRAQNGSSSTRAFAERTVRMSGVKSRYRYGFVFTFTVESRPRATKNGADTPECAPG